MKLQRHAPVLLSFLLTCLAAAPAHAGERELEIV